MRMDSIGILSIQAGFGMDFFEWLHRKLRNVSIRAAFVWSAIFDGSCLLAKSKESMNLKSHYAYGILLQTNVLACNSQQGTEYTGGSACLSACD